MPRVKLQKSAANDFPLKLSTSGSYKAINDLNKSSIEYRQNITLMVSAAKSFVKQVNENASTELQKTNYRVHVKQDNKLICIVSKNDIEWMANTEHLQSRYFPESDLAKRVESMFIRKPKIKDEDIKMDDLEDEMFGILNNPSF